MNGYITWSQARTLVEPYLKVSKSGTFSTDTSFINDENRPNQRDFRIKIQGKSLSSTPVTSSKGHIDLPLERRPSFHFEDTISCIRSENLDRNSLVTALHNHLTISSQLDPEYKDDEEDINCFWPQQKNQKLSMVESATHEGTNPTHIHVDKFEVVELEDKFSSILLTDSTNNLAVSSPLNLDSSPINS